jgi:hypothetical protein
MRIVTTNQLQHLVRHHLHLFLSVASFKSDWVYQVDPAVLLESCLSVPFEYCSLRVLQRVGSTPFCWKLCPPNSFRYCVHRVQLSIVLIMSSRGLWPPNPSLDHVQYVHMSLMRKSFNVLSLQFKLFLCIYQCIQITEFCLNNSSILGFLKNTG